MRVGAKVGAVRLVLLLCMAAAMFAVPSLASAEVTFCPEGSGAGQCKSPEGIAADSETGRVYVADSKNNRIDVFEANGNFLLAFGWGVDTGASKLETCTTVSGCQVGISGSGPGQFADPMRLAVDNNVGSASRHDVYVVEGGQTRIQKFEPAGAFLLSFSSAGSGACQLSGGSDPNVAVGPAGVVYVADSLAKGGGVFKTRIERFEPSGVCAGEVSLSPEETHRAKGIAVDSAGNFYIPFTAVGGFRKYSPTGAELYSRDVANGPTSGLETGAIAVDVSDDVFVTQRENIGTRSYFSIAEYSPAGAGLRRFGYSAIANAPHGVALYSSAGGDAFFSESGSVNYIPFPAGPIVTPASVETKTIGNVRATLIAEVNPEAKATSYRFDYVDQHSFEESGFSGPNAKSTPVASVGATDISLHTVEATVGCANPLSESGHPGETELEAGNCLKPETSYHFRVVATNADNPTGEGEARQEGKPFKTSNPIEIEATFASTVATDSATLSATVNPLGIPAKGYFEYVDDAAFAESGFATATKVPAVDGEPPAAELSFGSGETGITRSVSLSGLNRATTYHYRVVVDNPMIDPLVGPERVFRTTERGVQEPCPANEAFRNGASALLPDCRAYEMVSPVDKENGDAIPLNEATTGRPGVLEQSSSSGTRLAYGVYRAFGDSVSAPFTSQYIAARDPQAGWASHAISPPRTRLDIEAISTLDTEFKAFSADLCDSWLRTVAEPPLAAGAVEGFTNIYRRHDGECSGAPGYEAITTVTPPHRIAKDYNPLELQGLSADGSAALYAAPDNLTPEASALPGKGYSEGAIYTQEAQQLYERAEGELRFVCVLPVGTASQKPCQAGEPGSGLSRTGNVDNAISADGSRVFWTSYKNDPLEPGQIYLRKNPIQPQSPLAHGGATGTGNLTAGSKTVSSLVAAAGEGSLAVGSPTVSALKTTTGRFLVGQPIVAIGLPAGTTITAVSETTLTLSKNALFNNPEAAISSKGPQPFAVGQEIAATGIPAGTTITAVAPGSLTLSANATKEVTAASLIATSECTEVVKACTIAVSQQAEELSGISSSRYWTAAEDGSKAIFTTGSDLYEFDVDTETTTLIAGKSAGTMGASDDLSYLYFASEEALTGVNTEGKIPVPGKPNLYLLHNGTKRFIATLLAPELDSSFAAVQTEPIRRASRVSPDGRHAAFMTAASPTGYDNIDVSSGKPDAEVYLYDATSNAGQGKLVCASCNPTGSRPVGSNVDRNGRTSAFWVASQIQPWENTLYAARFLADDGSRLYFESTDALVLRDSNGVGDVYEWEAVGAGGCDEEDATFSVPAAGCIDLISSGESARRSTFVDASPSGNDVFFATLASLLPQDYGLVDIYDARAEGGFPQPPPLPVECEGEACQSPPSPAPHPTPASSVFEGAGNVVEEVTEPKRCPTGKVRRKGKCVARKHRRPHRHHRTNRNRRAAR